MICSKQSLCSTRSLYVVVFYLLLFFFSFGRNQSILFESVSFRRPVVARWTGFISILSINFCIMEGLFAIKVILYNYFDQISRNFTQVQHTFCVYTVWSRVYLDILLQNPESLLLPALARVGSLGRSKLQIFCFCSFPVQRCRHPFFQVLTGFCDFTQMRG